MKPSLALVLVRTFTTPLRQLLSEPMPLVVGDNCPVCLNTLAAAIAEEEMVIANDTPVSSDLLGVVKLETCSHHFCRKWCVRLLVGL